MVRFVIAIDGVKPGKNSNYYVTDRLESIFTATGKIISENEVALVLMNADNGNTDMRIILDTMNNYDRIKYINGYSRDIVSIFTRVEVGEAGEKNNNDDSGISHGNGKAMPSLKGNYLEPIDILEKSAIMNLMADGYLPLIFAPGAAVVKNLQYYSSVEGNVESNMYSSLLATLLEADTLIMITEAPLDSINPVHNSNGGMMKINYMELQKMYISGYYKNKDLSNIIKAVLSFITKGGSRSVIMPAGSIGSGIEIIK